MPYVQDISPSGAPVGESMIGTLAANLDRYQKARDERTRQINTINTALAQRGLQDKVTGTVDANGKMNFNLKGSGNESDTAAWEIANRLYQDDKTRIRSGTKMSREDVSDKAVSQIKDMAEDQRKNVDTRAYNITVAQQQKVPTPYGQLIGGNNNATTTNNLQAGIAAAGQLQSQNPMNSSGNTQSAAPAPSSTVLTPNTPSQTIGTQQQGALLSPSTGQPIVTAGSAAQSATNAPSATSGATASNAAATPPTTQTNSQSVTAGQSSNANYALKGSYKTGDVEADLPTSVVTTTVDNSFVDSIKTDIDKLMFASAMQSAIGNTDQAANFAKLAEKRHADMAKYTELLNSSGTSVAVDKSKMKITGAEGTAEASEGQGARSTVTVNSKTSVGGPGGGGKQPNGFRMTGMNGISSNDYKTGNIDLDINGTVKRSGATVVMGQGFTGQIDSSNKQEISEINARKGPGYDRFIDSTNGILQNNGITIGKGQNVPASFAFDNNNVPADQQWNTQKTSTFLAEASKPNSPYYAAFNAPNSQAGIDAMEKYMKAKNIGGTLIGGIHISQEVDQNGGIAFAPKMTMRKGINVKRYNNILFSVQDL